MSRTISEAFDRFFESELGKSKNKELAFNRADEQFSQKTGFNAYKDYDSYRTSRARRKKQR